MAEGRGCLRRYDRRRALQFLSLLELMTPLRVLGTSRKDQAEATDVMRSFSDQNLTLCDAVGLHVMKTREISVCWSTDFHLGLTGVPLIIHQN